MPLLCPHWRMAPRSVHLQDGAPTSGPEAAHVLSRAANSGRAMPTNASGPLFNNSSPSAALQWSLESRLRQRIAGSGCPLYELTWSQWDTPAGPQICRLRASGAPHIRQRLVLGGPVPRPGTARELGMHVRRRDGTADNGATERLFPTPDTPGGGKSVTAAKLKGNTYYAANRQKVQLGLESAAKLVGWATPRSTEWHSIGQSGQGDRQQKPVGGSGVSGMGNARSSRLEMGYPTTGGAHGKH